MSNNFPRAPWFQRMRKRILKRDGYKCRYCLKPAKTIDHVKPHVRGGAWAEHNLIVSCHYHNSIKGNMDLEEFFATKKFELEKNGQTITEIRKRIEESLGKEIHYGNKNYWR